MALEIFRLIGSVFVNTESANESLQKTDKKAEGVGKKFLGAVKSAGKFAAGVAAGAGAAGAAMVGLTNKAAAAMDVIDKGSAKIGISKQAYQEWSYVLGQNGMDISKMEVGMKSLVASMDNAANGNKTAKAKFKELGISIYDTTGKLKSQETMMNEVLYTLADMENGTEKARLATELFGKAGVEMMPMLNNGAKGMEDLKNRAHELGLVVSDDAVSSGVLLGDTMDDVKQSLGMIATKIGVRVMPLIQKGLDLILKLTPKIGALFSKLDKGTKVLKDAVKWGNEHRNVMILLGIALGTVTAAIAAYNAVQAVQTALGSAATVKTVAFTAAQWLATTATTAWGAAVAFLTSPITLTIAAIGALIAIIVLLVRNWDEVKAAAIRCWADIKTSAANCWEGIKATFSHVGEFFGGVRDSIKEKFAHIPDWFKEKFSRAWEAVKNVFCTGGKIFDGIKDGIATVFKTIVNKIISGINRVISIPFNKINSLLTRLRNTSILGVSPFKWINTFDVPQIPQLYEGGILNRGQMGLLEGNGAEAVVPLHNNKKWISAVARDMSQQGIGGNSDVGERLLEAFLDFVTMLPQMLSAANDGQELKINGREFARLVKAVP